MLEYWMQNGKAALSMIGYNKKKPAGMKDFQKLLKPIFKVDGGTSILSSILFYPIFNLVSKPRARYYVPGKNGKANLRDGYANFFANQVSQKTNSALDCIYCGKNGAVPIPSYVNPFITTMNKYPNAYSWGTVKSLALCTDCLLIGIAAHNRIIFKGSRPNLKTNFISMMLFFSKDEKDLSTFYKNFIDSSIVSEYFRNTNLFKKSTKQKRGYDPVWYPEEFLFIMLDYIARKITRLHTIDKQLGAIMFSFNFTGKTTIYDSFDVVDSLHPFVTAIKKFNLMTQKNPDAFKIFFRSLRFSTRIDDSGTFVLRRKFLKKLFMHKKIDWKLVEEFITLKAKEKSIIPFLKPFIEAMLIELKMPEQREFTKLYNLGYRLGMQTSKKENPNFGKSFMYELKKCPNPDKFLEKLHTLQTRLTSLIAHDDIIQFTENQKLFQSRKTIFLIGFTNALASKKISSKKS